MNRYQTACERLYRTIARIIAPDLRYSQRSYEDCLTGLVAPHVRWLDLGCGHQVLPEWRRRQEEALVLGAGCVVGADRDLAALRSHGTIRQLVCSDIGRLPFPAGAFDLVTANMVVEHLDAPEKQLREIGRVLTTGGIFMFHTGNTRGYYILFSRFFPERLKFRLAKVLQSRSSADVYPTHYRANTPAAIRRLAQAAGFEVHEMRSISSSPQTILLPMLLPLELLWIRLTMTRSLQSLRTNLIVSLRKRAGAGAAA